MRLLHTFALSVVLLAAFPAFAQVSLGTASNFGVLAGSAVTNTGPSVVAGNLGVGPGTAVTGFPPGLVTAPAAIHAADAVATQAQSDLTIAYVAITTLPATVDLTGTNLGGLTLTPGVYGFSSSAQLTGALTLDAQGNPDAVFIFRMGSTLTTASGASVNIINGGSACNVHWQVGSSATLGTATAFKGNILALTSITVTTGASVAGRLLARNGAVTLDSNNIAACAVAPKVCPAITLSSGALPGALVGSSYLQTVSAAGGVSPYVHSIAGSLPPGMTWNTATGAIGGTPTTAGTYEFTVTSTDSDGCKGSRTYTIGVAAGDTPPPIVTPPASIPTLSQWSLLALMLMLGVAAIRYGRLGGSRRG